MTRPQRKTVGQRAIDAWYRAQSAILTGHTTPASRVSAVRGFVAGYLAGWRAAMRTKSIK